MRAGHLPRVSHFGGGSRVRIFAPAKLNLHLAVGDIRGDGYHDVTTVLHSLDFGDTVVIEPGSSFGFSCTPDLGLRAEDNLACRAASEMSARFDRPLDLSISVEKHVPAGAGLGGASSDAAATILGLTRLWGIEGEDELLSDIARSLGADVPFFLTGGAARYSGRGDVLEQSLPALDAPVVLIKPAEAVSTAEAYAAFDRLGQSPAPSPAALTDALKRGDVREAARHLYNNMTEASVSLVPGIAGALRLVAESHGVLGSAMAGSGSAVFGICETDDDARRCADAARAAGLWGVATRTGSSGAADFHS